MFWRNKPTIPRDDKESSQAKSVPKETVPARSKGALLSLEPRLMFDAAAATTAAEVNAEQMAQEQAEAAVSGEVTPDSQSQKDPDSQDLIQAISTFMPNESRKEVVFVDPTVPNYRELMSGMDPNIEVIMLDGAQDGIEQMASALSCRTGIDAIHLISHGDAGTLQLGTGMLNENTMSVRYADELATIRQSLSEQADIIVYGCDFAEGQTGQAAVTQLAALTGADVQASSDLTGHSSLGGDWDLEVQTGTIEARIAIDAQAQANWIGLLAAPVLDATRSPTLSAILEDAGAPSGAVGTLISSLVDFASPSGQVDNVTDADSGARLGIALTGANISNGTWWYSTNNGASWNALGPVSDASARLLAADANTRIYFQANSNYNGTMSDAITFRAWDQTSGTNGGTANLSPTSTVLDQFNTVSYSNNDGTVKWTNSWQELGESDGTDRGMIVVNRYAGLSGNSLSIETDFLSSGASRQVDLSGVSSATLSFDYIRQHGGGTKGAVSVEVYNGKAWTSLQTFRINASDSTAQTYKVDISAYANANTQIRFIVTGSDSMGRLHVDNVQIPASGTDSSVSSASDTAGLTVTAVNDAPTDMSLSANTVAENAANGTVVGTVSGTDVDTGDIKTYSLTDTAGGRFAINSSTGQITVANSSLLDYESTPSHSVTVRVTDAGGLTYDETFTINVTNVNEAPVAADDRAGLTFDGVDDFVHMGSGAVYEVTDTMTMEAWINREPSSQASQIIINKEGEYEVGLDADGSLKWTFANTNPGWAWHDTGVVIPVHTWTHIAVTYDHGTITSYVNGVAVETFAGSGTIGDAHPTKDSLQIGSRENNPAGQYFKGQISEAQVWNVARTVGEIAGDLNGTLGGSETGLLGYWKFNENTGTTADNLTANSDGTLGNGLPGQTPEWAIYQVNEDTTLTVASGAGVMGNDYDVDGDTLSALMVTGPSHASAFTLNPDGSFSYTPAANFSGTDSFTYRVSDGINQSNVATAYIQVGPVNDAPTDLSLSANTVAENAANGTVIGTISGTDPDSADTKTYSLTDSAGGRFAINSSTGQITVANGSLLDYESAPSHGVTVRVTDGGGLTYDETFTINLTNVNEAPTGADATITINEDTMHTLTTANFGFSDVDAGDSLSAVRIDTLPSAGSLTLSGMAVTAGQVITVADLTAGNLVFTPVTDANGTGYASFTFSVRDSSSAYDTTPNTLTFNVTAVNDAPIMAINTGSTVAEGGTDTIDASELAVTDVDSSTAQLTYSISTGPVSGRLELTTASGVTATTFTQADIAANRLIYLHDGSETTSDSFTFTVNDGAGGTLGATTMTLTIIPVNDTPIITSDGGASMATVNVAEHVSAVTIVTGADVDLPTQALTYNISGGVDLARFTINAATGALNFTAPPNFEVATDANGDNVYVVQVQVVDSQGASTTQTIQVTVTDVAEGMPSPLSAVPPVLLSPTPPPPAGEPTSRPGTSPPAEPVTSTPVSPGPMVPSAVEASVNMEPVSLMPPTDRSETKVAEEPNRPTEEARDASLFLVNDDQERPLFTVLPVESVPPLEPDPSEAKPSVSDLLITKLDEMTASLEQAAQLSQEHHELIARIAAVTGTTLTVGFVAWALRSGTILASCLATVPAWRHFDPLPVVKLTRQERARRRDEATRAQQEEAEEFSGLKRVLDDKLPLKRTA